MPSTDSATKSAEIVPTYNFDELEISLKTSPDATLGSLLTQLATIPAPAQEKVPEKKVGLTEIEAINEEMQRSSKALAEVFGKTSLPATRRALRNVELDKFLAEKLEIAAAKKALDAREKQIGDAVATHFDVVAEKSGAAKPGKTPVDQHGHYLIGGSSKDLRQEARTPGASQFFAREKSKDTVEPSIAKLQELLDAKEITRAEFLSLTSPVTTRVINEAAFRRGLLSKTKRQRTQEILSRIGNVKRGALSLKIRK